VTDVLTDRGYEHTRFADVSAASGVAISTLQNYFGSREDMLVEALRHATDQEMAALEATAAAEHVPWERLVALIDRSLGSPRRTQQMLVEFWRSAMRDEELREHSVEVQARYREPFRRAVTDGRDRGVFELTHSPDDVTDFVLAALAGAIIPRLLHQPTPTAAGFRSILMAQVGAALGLGPAGTPRHGEEAR
jgi:AcrR family transcriptional regulator